MFRLHKHRSSKSEEKIDFIFSHFKALQVPKGWDKLFVSVISTENGKTIAKSSKVLVRNGSCQWADTISESIWVSKENSLKEIEDSLLKFVVATGSSRSGILGEATVSMTSYMSSSAATPLSIPLNKCNHGTVLHVTVQCLTPRTKFRGQETRDTNSQSKALNTNNHDVAVKSNGSDCSYVQSIESFSNKDLDSMSARVELESRETSFSGSSSHCSYNWAEGSVGKGNFSPSINSGDDAQSTTERQDSTSSKKSVSHYPVDSSSQSNHPSFNSQIMGSENISCMHINSSKNHLEVTEDTVEELQAEAKMWEINARKLVADLDVLRAEFSDQSKNLENLGVVLSAAYVERDSLKTEVEQLKLLLKDPVVKQKALKDSISQDECVPELEKALKDELKFQKESNANMSLQLKRSQEANIELVSILQELEQTIEQQKNEIVNLSALSSKLSDMENSLQLSTERNSSLMLQLEQLEECKENLLAKVQQLEEALEDKKHDIENANIPNKKIISDIKMEYEGRLSAKEEELLILKAKLSESLQERCHVETGSRDGGDADLMREIEELKEKVQELEMDCNELTDENLELLFKLKEANKKLSKEGASEDFFPNKLQDQCFASSEPGVSNSVFRILHSEDMLKGKVTGNMYNSDHSLNQEVEHLKSALEVRIIELTGELADKTSEITNLKANLSSKEKEVEVLQKRQSDLEAKLCHLQNERIQLEEHMVVMLKERDVNSKCLYDLQNDLATVNGNMETHVCANRRLERKSSELEDGKHELQLHISEIELEKEQLSIRMSVLETQLRDLANERESSLSELQNSRVHAARLQKEILRINSEMDASKEDSKQKLKLTQFQWSEAIKECEYLRSTNQQLQTAIENLSEECYSLKKFNRDLRKQNLEFQEYCSLMGTRLKESDQRFADCYGRVEILEKELALMLEDNASKEKSLTSELNMLLDENGKHLKQGQSLLNQVHMEKTAEIQKLEQEIEQLRMKLSAAYDEKEVIASNAVLEVSALLADKTKLESAFEEVQSQVISSKNEVNVMRIEYEQKLQELTTELVSFKTNQKMLMADHEKLLKMLEDYKSRELKVKSTMNALELKLTVAEYERQQLLEESGNLKIQLQRITQFENEIMALKNEINSTNFEKERLQASLQRTSEICEDLEMQKNSFAVKVLSLDKAVSELEDCRKSRADLEERLAQVENDLMAKETLLAQNAEQKNELSHIKRINRQYQQTIQLLEQEKVEFQTTMKTLEEELQAIKEQKRNQVSKINRKASPVHEDLKVSKNLMVKNTSQNRSNRKKPSSKNDREILKDQQDLCSNKHQSEVETECELPDESVHTIPLDLLSKIQSLEAELAKAREANSMYEVQLNRFLSQGQNKQANAPIKSTSEGELVTKEIFERTKSMLEAELRDIRERYFHMSLKYAEVEAQREELVMKLKVAKNQKGWLS